MIQKFVMFALNFPPNWIEKCFLKESGLTMTNHLKSKWHSYYNIGGPSGAMILFYASLDQNNQTIFDNFLNNS